MLDTVGDDLILGNPPTISSVSANTLGNMVGTKVGNNINDALHRQFPRFYAQDAGRGKVSDQASSHLAHSPMPQDEDFSDETPYGVMKNQKMKASIYNLKPQDATNISDSDFSDPDNQENTKISDRFSKSSTSGILAKLANSKVISMINDVGDWVAGTTVMRTINSVNPVVGAAEMLNTSYQLLAQGDIVNGASAAGLAALSLIPGEGLAVGELKVGANLSSKLEVFSEGESALKQRVLANIAESKAARSVSNFAVYGAKEKQIIAGYNADAWIMTTLRKGDIVYGGLPGQSAFYTNEETILASQGNKITLYKNLQAKLNPERGGYRSNIGEYVVTQDMRVPTGIVSANPTLGAGGARQFFINNFGNRLELINDLELGEFYGNRLPSYRPSR